MYLKVQQTKTISRWSFLGSIIGLNIAHQYPKYIEAYIGIGQIVHMKQNEELLYQHLIHSAKHDHKKH